MSRRNRRGSNNTIRIGDLTQVETGFKEIEEGRHIVTVEAAEIKESQTGNPYISFEFQAEGESGKIFHNSSLQPHALFNLKSVLQALGFGIPDKAFDLDLTELIGLECEVEVTHEVYEGKKRPRITEFYATEGVDDEYGDDLESELEELDIEELEGIAKALGVKGTRKMDEDDLIDEILAFEDDEIEEAMDESDDESDYEDMSLKELRAEARDRGIKVKRSMDEDDLIDLLVEDDDE